ncbi:MAG: hypothetical protein HWE39_06280 [Oceanospirillaceae bacterium]|uniref:type I restriction enzyme HsdR N-terminal domain-containing protein n=1 Tax=Roseobacteraceae TaxID=2854170 RepID=UPI00142DE7DC|nr:MULTISPECIES: type I restriction enzyme HsdR N-terminal domain-containing protein [Roseobacteraceae]NIY96695.1 hypothetical protein [Salipiger sp. HF18]NIZ11954.1 hypothetical protein [Phaeobacter sp. HF9A]NVK40834.1 hypothetical protein [Oceanospirillaceae bacterium]
MKVTNATKSETEAQLETRARDALLKALPWLDGKEIEQQTSFTIRFGHAVLHVDGKERQLVTGRADILVTVRGVHTLVLELKRPGLGINDDDVEQGLSYARILHPRPPLVLATDGTERRLVETQTGMDWRPASQGEEALKALLDNVALVAADDMKRATSRLLGTDPKAWIEAVRAVSDYFIEERTGGWTTPELPFVNGFLFSRKAVAEAVKALKDGKRLVFVEGDPVSGKSSALRALAEQLNAGDNFAVLTLDADSGIDLFSALSDILSSQLFWPITPHEARHWVQQLSRTEGPPLVVAVDDFGGARGRFRQDLEALTSPLFGDRIRVVLALDTGAAHRLLTSSNGRTPSALKRRDPERFFLEPLDDDEYATARDHLKEHGISIMAGGERSREYRLPWVLRSMVGSILAGPTLEPGTVAILPPIPTLQLLSQVEQRYRDMLGAATNYREVAQALVEDLTSDDFTYELRLLSLDTYIVRKSALRELLSDADIRELLDAGLLHEGRSEEGEAILYPKLQDLLALHLAQIFANRITENGDLDDVANDLAGLASSVPLGPVIAAYSIFLAAKTRGTLDYKLIEALRSREPRRENEALPPGRTVTGLAPDGHMFEMTGLPDGQIELRVGDVTDIVDGEGIGSIVDIDPWMILSYLATWRIAVDSKDEDRSARLDAVLMLQIGSYPEPLIKPGNVSDMVETHSLPGGVEALHFNGIFEPVTYAMLLFFTREPEHAATFVAAAREKESLPLMLRIDAALTQLAHFSGDASEVAAELLREVVRPAVEALLKFGDEADAG